MRMKRLLSLMLMLMAVFSFSYAETWTVAGEFEFSGWVADDASNDMTALEGTSLWYLTKDVELRAGTYQYKVVKDHAWDVNYPSDNRVLTVDQDIDKVTFWFNEETHEVWATYVYSIIGNFWDDWATDKDMVDIDSSYIYRLVVNEFEATEGQTYNFKARANHAWADYQIPASGNKSWTCPATGTYKLIFSLNVKYNDLYLVAEDITPHTYVVAGNAAILGVTPDWTVDETNTMGTVNNYYYTLTKENVLLAAGNYEYKIVKDGDIWIPADNNKVLEIAETGYYNITFNFIPQNETINAAAELISTCYLADFNTAIATGNHAFAVAGHWKHIVDELKDSYGDTYYMSYSYKEDEGVNGSGALLAYRQYAYDQSNSSTNKVTYDLLVTPVVSGTISMQVKASGSASTSIPAFVELYSLNENGTERVELLQRFDEGLSTSEWTTITYEVASEQRIGIRAQHVYLDNFVADVENTPLEAGLTINSVADVDGASTTYFNQQADGTILARYKVMLTNSGDVDLNPGDENYTLSLFNRSYPETTYGAFEIPVALAVGESTTEPIIMEVSLPAEQKGWKYWDVKENVSGTTLQGKWAGTKEYVSKFVFDKAGTSYTSSPSATTTPIDFGKVSESTTVSYEIYNAGLAPLTINSFAIDEPFTSNAPEGEFEVAGGEKKQIDITFPAAEAGIFTGNITIEYTNFGAAEPAVYTLAVNATTFDASKSYITFDDGQGNKLYPQGSVRYNAYISSEDGNYYMQGSGNNPLYITPLMTAEEGETITFDAKSGSKVEVMISTDRQEWTTIQTVTDLNTYNWKSYTATIPEAGNYYLGFKMTSSKVDNIYGLVCAATPEHDLLLIGADVPATATQNADYTATMKVGNVGPNVEAAGAYTASLYVGGEEVATANDVDLPVADISGNYNNGEEQNYTTLNFTYKPHTAGEFEAYVEVKAGDVVLTSEKVQLVIAEEKVDGDVSLEGSTFASRLTVVAPYYNHSGSESLLTASVLESMGITNGAKISRIYVNGYNTSGETTHATKVWIGNTEATELSNPFEEYDVENNSENLALVMDEDHVYPQAGTSSNPAPMFEINFGEETPFEYTGGSIRIIAKADVVTSYKNISFEKSSVTGYCQAYSYDSGSQTYYATELPKFHFELIIEPTVLAGTVTDANGAVEGATVTLRNAANDVEYAATTDAEGKYEINVIQNNLPYKAVADKEGLVSDVVAVANFETALDFTLAAPEYGEIWTGYVENADLSAGYFKYLAQEYDKLVVTYENPDINGIMRFTNNQNWSTVYAYAWDANEEPLIGEWPGVELTEPYLNENDEQVYSFEYPGGTAGIVFSNGEGAQTVNITDFDVTGYWTDGSTDNQGHYNVTAWPNISAVELIDAAGNVVATLSDGNTEIELTSELISQLAKGLFVSVKGNNAFITKVELLEPEYILIAEDAVGVEAAQNVNVKIERKFKAGWNAVMLPVNILEDDLKAIFGEDCEVARFNGDETNENGNVSIKFCKSEYQQIWHGYPCLLWLSADVENVKLINTEIFDGDIQVADNGTAFNLVGTYEPVIAEAGDMFIQGGKFVTATSNNTVKPFRSYLKKMTDDEINGVRIVIGDEVVTSINGLNLDNVIDMEGVYNLNGQKTTNLRKGLYIINGKKVVVK